MTTRPVKRPKPAFGLLLALFAGMAYAGTPPLPPDEPRPDAGAYAVFAIPVHETFARAAVRAAVGPTDTPLPLDLANFLLDHPDLAAFIVHRHKIAPYSITMRGPRQSWADDGDGTRGLFDLVSRTETSRVYYGEGQHRGFLLPTILASAVIAMELREQRGPDCRPRTRISFFVYVRMKNRFVSGLVRTLRPVLEKTVVGKFSKAFFVADQVGRLLAHDPGMIADDIRDFPLLSSLDRDLALRMVSRLQASPPSLPSCEGPGSTPGPF